MQLTVHAFHLYECCARISATALRAACCTDVRTPQKRTVHPQDTEIIMDTLNIHASGQHSPRAGKALDVG